MGPFDLGNGLFFY